MPRAPWVAPLLASAVLLASQPATADVQLQSAVGLSASKTEWRGDLGASFVAKGGLKINDWLTFYLLGRLGYVTVDQRMLTFVSAGAQVAPFGRIGFIEPYLRLSLAHAHEESLSVVGDDPIGAIFGIGDGIRHRGGLEGGLGFHYFLAKYESAEAFAGFELSTIWFYDPRGPHWYVNGTAGIGLNYDL